MIAHLIQDEQNPAYDLLSNFFNDTATTEIYTDTVVGSVRCV